MSRNGEKKRIYKRERRGGSDTIHDFPARVTATLIFTLFQWLSQKDVASASRIKAGVGIILVAGDRTKDRRDKKKSLF